MIPPVSSLILKNPFSDNATSLKLERQSFRILSSVLDVLEFVADRHKKEIESFKNIKDDSDDDESTEEDFEWLWKYFI